MPQQMILKLSRRKIILFLRCILISFITWLLIALSNTYIFEQYANISYVNIPENKAFHPLQSEDIRVNLKLSGWDYMVKSLRPDTTQLEIDLSSLKNRSYVVLSNQIGFINRQYPDKKQVVSVAPDTLYFDFSKQTQRKVPVKAIFNLDFKKRYGITGDIQSNPEYITVTGPIDEVAKIENIETDSIKGKNIKSNLRTVSHLNNKHKNNITLYPDFAEILIPVGEMTEKYIELSLKVENASEFTSVRTLPNRVKINVLIPLEDYNKRTARDFEAVVDMTDWIENKASSLPVLLVKTPPYCKVLNIEPKNVDFFVRK